MVMAYYGNSELVTYPEMPALTLLRGPAGFLAALSALSSALKQGIRETVPHLVRREPPPELRSWRVREQTTIQCTCANLRKVKLSQCLPACSCLTPLPLPQPYLLLLPAALPVSGTACPECRTAALLTSLWYPLMGLDLPWVEF